MYKQTLYKVLTDHLSNKTVKNWNRHKKFTQGYNDSFVKKYLTALIKRQWGQNLIKFKGTKLPGGVELNGRDIYDDAIKDLEDIKERMSTEYEVPPLDFIG